MEFADSEKGKQWLAQRDAKGNPKVLQTNYLLNGERCKVAMPQAPKRFKKDGEGQNSKKSKKKVCELHIDRYRTTGCGEIEGYMGELQLLLLIDTCSKGEGANFMSKEVFRAIKVSVCVGEIRKQKVGVLMGNRTIWMEEFVVVNVVINGDYFRIPFYITSHLNEPSILIGRETIAKYKGLQDLLKETIDAGMENSLASNGNALRMSSMLTRISKADFFEEEYDSDEVEEEDIGMLLTERGSEPPARVYGSEVLQKMIHKVCEKYEGIFSSTLTEEAAKIAPFSVKVDKQGWDSARNRAPARQQGPAKEAELRRLLDGLLEIKVIRASQALAHSQVLLVRKKDGSFRLVIDYRILNDVTTSEGYPIPNIKEMCARIGRKRPRYFGVVDMVKGYHQVELKEEAKACTAFVTAFGKYEWNRAPMGLKGLPSLFQCAMVNEVLQGIVYQKCECYMDDIIIFGETEKEFVDNVSSVFERLQRYNIKLSAGKCVLGAESIEFVGHTITKEGVCFSKEKIAHVIEFPTPVCQKDVKSFIGLANYFRDHLRGHSQQTRALEELVKDYHPGAKVEWKGEAKEAFEAIKESINGCPMLFFIQAVGEIHLYTDACDTGIGGYLCQRVGDVEYPVGFMSRAFSSSQKKWHTPTQECYAIFKALEKFEYLLRDVKFILHTDHKNLTHLDVEGSKLIRAWKMAILEYDFDIEYVTGPDNVVADYFSRMQLGEKSIEVLETEIAATRIMTSEEKLRVSNMLMKERVTKSKYQCVQLSKEDYSMCQEVHNDVAGHSGVEKMIQRLEKKDVSWKYMRQSCKLFIQQCPCCQKMDMLKFPLRTHRYTLSTYGIMDRLVIDTIGPLPKDRWGNEYVMVVMDSFSKWVELFPTQTVEGEEAASKLLSVIGRYGCPLQIQTDNGTQFKNSLMDKLTELLGTEYIHSLAYSKEENGIVERANKEVSRHIRNFVFDRNKLVMWSECLPLIQRILNSAKRGTGLSPAEIMFGNNINLDRGIFMPLVALPSGKTPLLAQWVDKMVIEQHLLLKQAVDQQMMIDGRELVRREEIDSHLDDSKLRPVVENQFVLVRYPQRVIGNVAPNKLVSGNRGPMRVVNISQDAVSVQDLLTLKCETVHVSRVKPYTCSVSMTEEEVVKRDTDEWLIEEVVGHNGIWGRLSHMDFLVKFVGLPEKWNLWYKWSDMRANPKLHEYLIKIGQSDKIPDEFREFPKQKRREKVS